MIFLLVEDMVVPPKMSFFAFKIKTVTGILLGSLTCYTAMPAYCVNLFYELEYLYLEQL